MKNFVHVLDGVIVAKYKAKSKTIFAGPWVNAEVYELSKDLETDLIEIKKINKNGKYEFEVREPENYYQTKRLLEYPLASDYLDGIVKSHSPDDQVKAEGLAQIEKYISDCLAVKEKYPKKIAQAKDA